MLFRSGHVPAAVARLTPLHRLAATNQMSLSIGLPLRDRAGLTNLLREVYDPTSLQYRHYLTPDRFTEKYGPSRADLDQVIAFARTNGLTPTHAHPNRMLLDVAGSVRDIEHAFGIKLNVYQHPTEQRQFYAPDTEPSVGVQTPILDVSGLNNYALPRRAGLKRPPPGGAAGPMPENDTGSGTNGAFMAGDIRAAYAPGVTLTGAGQRVALVEVDDGYYPSDIIAYEHSNNLAHVVLTNVLVDWASGKPGSGRPLANGGSANAEISLDMEMVIAMAPGISQIIVYQVPTVVTVYGSSFIYVNDLLNRIATDNLAKQISSSLDRKSVV